MVSFRCLHVRLQSAGKCRSQGSVDGKPHTGLRRIAAVDDRAIRRPKLEANDLAMQWSCNEDLIERFLQRRRESHRLGILRQQRRQDAFNIDRGNRRCPIYGTPFDFAVQPAPHSPHTQQQQGRTKR